MKIKNICLTDEGDEKTASKGQNCKLWCQKHIFNKKTINKRLPITAWLPKYDRIDFLGDLVAGITVGLTVIPQALAYAGIAGLDVKYGLYGSFLGAIVYIFLGSCKDVPMGPSAISALLTFTVTKGNIQKTVLLCFLSGIIEFMMGALGLGFLLDFVSGPVSSGFTSAVSVIIITSQIKDLLGIHANGSTFLKIWMDVAKNIHETRWQDLTLSISCIIVILLLRILSRVRVGPKDELQRTKKQKYMTGFFWIFGTSRNAIMVITCACLVYGLELFGYSNVFTCIPEVEKGLPQLTMIPFSLTNEENGGNGAMNFFEMVAEMGFGLVIIPLISLMENISVCKAFADGNAVNTKQEFIAIGAGNILNSFLQTFPGNGALSRAAVNNASGVCTPMGNIYTAIIVLLSLQFFTPCFKYIPKATLAAIIVAAVIFMIEIKVYHKVWRTKKIDILFMVITFISCLLLPLEIGIFIGVAVNSGYLLYNAARPNVDVSVLKTNDSVEYLMLTPDRCLMFPSVDYVRNLVNKQSLKSDLPVVIDCSHVHGVDFSAASVIQTLCNDFKNRQQQIFFYNLTPSVLEVFEGMKSDNFIVFYRIDRLDDLINENKPSRRSFLSNI
ncbi:SLC26A11.2 family protein [Megaselia abdita]